MFLDRLPISRSNGRSVLVLACLVAIFLGTACSSESPSSERAEDVRAEQPRRTIEARTQELLLQGEQAFQRGAYLEALALADSAEQYDPDAAVIPFFRGSVYTAMNRLNAAQKAFQAALERDSQYPEVHLRMGDNALRLGNQREALRLYRREAEITPSAALYERMGRTYTGLGMADSARLAYEQAIQLDSTNAHAHMWYGQLLEEAGELEAGLQHSRKAVDLQPDQPNFQFAVGSQLYQLGRLEEAVEPLRQAADGQLLHYPAQHTLSQVLIRLGREAEAEQYEARADSARQLMQQITSAEEAASRNPNAAEYWVRLGELYREAEEESRAAQAFERARSIQSQ